MPSNFDIPRIHKIKYGTEPIPEIGSTFHKRNCIILIQDASNSNNITILATDGNGKVMKPSFDGNQLAVGNNPVDNNIIGNTSITQGYNYSVVAKKNGNSVSLGLENRNVSGIVILNKVHSSAKPFENQNSRCYIQYNGNIAKLHLDIQPTGYIEMGSTIFNNNQNLKPSALYEITATSVGDSGSNVHTSTIWMREGDTNVYSGDLQRGKRYIFDLVMFLNRG